MNYKLYEIFIGLIVTIMIVCDTLVYKTIDIAGLKITASGIIFSLSFLLLAIATDTYGYKVCGRIIWVVIICQSLFVILINVVVWIQPNNNEISKLFNALFHEFWRVMVGTWTGVPAAYFANSFIVSKLKIFFKGRWFFLRYIVSVAVAQGILLLASYPISLSSIYSIPELINIIGTTWSYKILVSIILLPIGVYLVGVVKRIEGTDPYDHGISYNPFMVFNPSKQTST